MMPACTWCIASLTLISLLLFISVCINLTCFLRNRNNRHKADKEEFLYQQHYPRESLSRLEEEEEEEEDQQQENPIYGNITTDLCYEPMTKQRSRDDRKPAPQHHQPDLNYASLDLNVGQIPKKRKRRYQQAQAQAQTLPETQMDGDFLEIDAEMEASLPSRSSSPLASRNSIYLNSLQMALETEERE
ncbi:uncharacterized protein LOC129864166 [Salvelinus fontinalis]|uniref:uncharacterized protein LOC129864166 n=1 Tax=Salvelinus fontinalis TaxID=8038 RepID=UPI002485C8ED|nr:uncharacterized protein LOC129864166 [Salvelinus fontinalis]